MLRYYDNSYWKSYTKTLLSDFCGVALLSFVDVVHCIVICFFSAIPATKYFFLILVTDNTFNNMNVVTKDVCGV